MSNLLGAGDPHRARVAMYAALILAEMWQLCAAGAVILFRRGIVLVFSDDDDVSVGC